jgi:porphobilinogen deaminase
LSGVVLSADGRQRLFAEAIGTAEEAEALGCSVAQSLLNQGASDLIQAARHA